MCPDAEKIFIKEKMADGKHAMLRPELFTITGLAVFHIDRPRLCIAHDLLLQFSVGGHL